jgi:hypothetical protein
VRSKEKTKPDCEEERSIVGTKRTYQKIDCDIEEERLPKRLTSNSLINQDKEQS